MSIEDRCSVCGSPPQLTHLRNCKFFNTQLVFLIELIELLGRNVEDYPLNSLTVEQFSKLIAELKETGDKEL